ncbi:MAG: efflux RND transporter periplasmic adaptor subunit [Candidatus Lindowbacteria bacterium]|nr:efflux RND transporter periplasmic adaptor subunit [Candidatus Lindowbacteria bacterium]
MAKKKGIIVGIAVVVILGVAVAGGIMVLLPEPTTSTETPPESKSANIRVLEVKTTSLKEWIELPASAEPYLMTEVPAEVGGRIDWIGPKEGQFIAAAGTPLLRIDQRTFKAQVDEAQAAHDLALNNCKRIEQLHKEGIMSNEQLDQCKANAATAAARLEVAKVQLDKSTVRTPVAGVLNKWRFDAGEYVNQGDRVADMVVIDPVKILVKAPEKDAPYVHKGETVQISFDFIDKRFEGSVTYISVVGDPETRTYDVEITVPNPKREILPSMIATASMLRREIPNAITVPLFAVIPRGDIKVVFVEKDGKAEERVVELGILEGDRVQIVSGIEPNDRLIVEGHRELEDGAPVRVQGMVEAQS